MFDRVASGCGGSLVLRGPAGIGKSRLLDEVMAYARASDWRSLVWQAIEPTHTVAFAPFSTLLAHVVEAAAVEAWDEPERSGMAMILPQLGIAARVPFGDRAALVIALVAAIDRLASDKPLLIAIDDLPLLDDASNELLVAIASMLTSRPVLIAVTYRDDEPMPEESSRLVEALRRVGAVDLHLDPLGRRDLEALTLSHLGGEALAPELEEILFSRSVGNPLYCLEMARGAAVSGSIVLEHRRWRVEREAELRRPPESVRQIVTSRWKALPPGAAELLRVAAELGNDVNFATLSALGDVVGGDLIGALDHALASGLLVERGTGYAFAHPLFREAVEAESGTPRRAQFHLSIAAALAGARTSDPDDIGTLVGSTHDLALVAEHALRAAELGLREAAPLAIAFGFGAGLRARELFDRTSATAFLSRSLAVWERAPKRSQAQFDASTAWVNLGELQVAAGDEPGGQRAFANSIAAARSPYELAAAYDRYLWVPYRHGDFEGAIALTKEALNRLPAEASVPRAIMRQWSGWCVARLHRFDEAVEEVRDAVAIYESADDRPRLSYALDMLGTLLPFLGRMDEAIECLERSLAIALDLHSTRLEQVRVHLASTLTRAGRAAEARPHAKRAIELADLIGDWYLKSVACWLAAEMEDSLGDYRGARDYRLQELTLLERIGGNPHNEALARAHLAHLARLAGDVASEAAEAARARLLAAADPEPGYASRIEVALGAERWSDLATG